MVQVRFPRHSPFGPERPQIARFALFLVLVTGLLGGLFPASSIAAEKKPVTAKDQLEFGVQMAQRGLWSEALFRFRQADTLDPDNPEVLNNLAISYEALGLFEKALEHYRRALEGAPDKRTVRRNYARFVEFYQAFNPAEEDEESDDANGGPSESALATDDEQTEEADGTETESGGR